MSKLAIAVLAVGIAASAFLALFVHRGEQDAEQFRKRLVAGWPSGATMEQMEEFLSEEGVETRRGRMDPADAEKEDIPAGTAVLRGSKEMGEGLLWFDCVHMTFGFDNDGKLAYFKFHRGYRSIFRKPKGCPVR